MVKVNETLKGNFKITLKLKEAEFLYDLVGNGVIGGGRRKYGDKIFDALYEAGVPGEGKSDMKGVVEFISKG